MCRCQSQNCCLLHRERCKQQERLEKERICRLCFMRCRFHCGLQLMQEVSIAFLLTAWKVAGLLLKAPCTRTVNRIYSVTTLTIDVFCTRGAVVRVASRASLACVRC